ncbi:MAG: DUF4288 domain-containing protein [Anaerolineae bacterium]|nr:DUF4288 domain-containing protein [Anaerolineae bacterium]
MNSKWFLAELIVEFHVENESSRLVHINSILVSAKNAEEAYSKALHFGQRENTEYTNTDGNLVTVTFRGLRDLNIIHEELADGSEIIYEEYEDVDEDDISHTIAEKDQLAVFMPRNGDENLRISTARRAFFHVRGKE